MPTIYKNAQVFTDDGVMRGGFAVEGDRFVQVGDDAALLATRQPGDEVIDLAGHFVCAGFNDSHMHLLGFGQALTMAPLHRHTRSLADMLNCLRDFLREHPPLDGWLLDMLREAHDFALAKTCRNGGKKVGRDIDKGRMDLIK